MPQPEAPIAQLLGQQSSGKKFSVRAALTKLIGLHRDARECFCGDDGAVRPAAQRLFAAFAKEARFNAIGLEPSSRDQDYRKGWQDAVRWLAGKVELDTAKLEELQRKYGDR